jgi:hypothetical protein
LVLEDASGNENHSEKASDTYLSKPYFVYNSSLTLNLGFPPIAAAILAYSDTGRRLPHADLGRFAIVWELNNIDCS